MRFMMLMIPKGCEQAPPGTMPDPNSVAAMMKYNESLRKAGVLVTLDGLHPPSMGARVSFSGGKPKVTEGPFAETEVTGGYYDSGEVQARGHRMGFALPGFRQRSDRGSAGPGVYRLPSRSAGSGRRIFRDAGASGATPGVVRPPARARTSPARWSASPERAAGSTGS